ncbi:MAG: hypothetical protein JOY84_23205 [Curvibacter sp.]|nr:hypothetical protein [Curvibacter sp.]
MRVPFLCASSLALASLLSACAVQAPAPQPAPHVQYHEDHPAYLHALSDLRAARWLIAHRPGDVRVSVDEDAALSGINQAIGEIKRAAIDDGKNIDDHPPIDEHLDHRGRLHRARELLQKSRNDIAREEDNGAVRGLRDRSLHHIDEALRATDLAIRDAANGI